MKALAIGAGAFAAAFVGVIGAGYLPSLLKAGVGAAHAPPPRAADSVACDDRATVETVKRLAAKKIVEIMNPEWLNRYDYQAGSVILQAAIHGNAEFTVTSFRERQKIGNGIVCAAQVAVLAGKTATAEMSTEYSVEPTTDGKVMITARFMPN